MALGAWVIVMMAVKQPVDLSIWFPSSAYGVLYNSSAQRYNVGMTY